MASNAIGLIILAVAGGFATDALFPAFAVWLPGSMVANWLGTALTPRLPEVAFRRLTLGIVFMAGGLTTFSTAF